MPRNRNRNDRNDNTSSSNLGAYIAAGVVGAVAAGIGYYFGKNSETSHTSENRTHQHTTNRNYTDTDPDCAICFEDMTPVRVLPCKHKFHDHCITKWVDQKPVCPKCNASTEFLIRPVCPKCNVHVE